MALLWFDGFENYNDINDISPLRNSAFTSLGYEGTNIGFGAYGRRSTRGIKIWYTAKLIYTLASNYASFVAGIALYQNDPDIPSYNANYPFFGFYDDTTLQLGFYIVGTEIHVYSNGVKLGETSGADINCWVWRYVEVKFTINNTTGTVEVRVNENILLTLSNVDTQNSADAYFNKFKLGPSYNNIETLYDDLYLCDTAGTKNNDFLGDVRVDVLRPNGAGTYTQFTPSAGANYENVDEVYPDDDTTYNQGSLVDDKDAYNVEDLPSPPASTVIHGVKSQITVRKTDAGARECKILTRSGATDTLGDALVLSDSYLTPTKIYEDNPDDSLAWEDADVNAMQVGVQITV